VVAWVQVDQPDGQVGVGAPPDGHAQGGERAGGTCEAGVVGVVVGDVGGVLVCHASTLTVEPEFKSSGRMDVVDEHLLTIGEVARRAGVATSTLRYYERRGLVAADARRSGQRRYRTDSLRRLVFIGMLQDAGLSLDDIVGILDAPDADAWKAIASRRLAVLDAEIERLLRARSYLGGALLCRYDHPATDCRIMGAEIDRRLDATAPAVAPAT
jgi:DNA-binding transcriptional MerR regulator